MWSTMRHTCVVACAVACMTPTNVYAQAQNVTWAQLQNATVSGTTLQKSGGCHSCPDSGAVSQQEIASGNGYVEFAAGQTNALKIIGLSNGNPGTSGGEIKWGLSFSDQLAIVEVRESGTYRGETSYTATNVFRIAVENGAVKYYKDGVVFYTSQVAPTYPLLVDTALLSSASQFSNVVISGSASGTSCPGTVDTTRTPYTKPSLPAIQNQPAGHVFADPCFGSPLIRVTTGQTRPGLANRSYTTSSAAHQNTWNTDSTYFYIRATDGTIIPYRFDPSTQAIARILPTGSGDGGVIISSQAEPNFSFNTSNVLWGSSIDPLDNTPTVTKIQLSPNAAPTYSTELALRTVASGLAGKYTGGVYSSATSPERISVFFGGSMADLHNYVLLFDAGSGANQLLLNTSSSTVKAGGQTYSTNITLGFTMHHAYLDKSGRYVLIMPQGAQPYQQVLWDTHAAPGQGFTAMPVVQYRSGGHDAMGWGDLVNQDCCTSTSYDALQWQYRALATPAQTRDLIQPVQTPTAVYTGDHTSWNNASATALLPVLSSITRLPGDAARPWRAWDDEIVAIQTNSSSGATVWRFAHHRSDGVSDTPGQNAFWYAPRVVVSQDGKWALFTSNWEKTLGPASDATAAEQYRRDVFILGLNTGVGGSGPENVAWTNGVNATISGSTLQKSGGCEGCPDAGAVSVQQIGSAGGYIEFTAGSGHYYTAGLSNDTSSSTSHFLPYAFSIWPSGIWEVREQGTWKKDGTYTAGQTLRIAVEGGTVKYYVNGALVHTSTAAPTYPLMFDTSLLSSGAVVSGAKIKR